MSNAPLHRIAVAILVLLIAVGCTRSSPESAGDSTAMTTAPAADSSVVMDTAAAMDLLDAAKEVLATLLSDPASARLDSLRVIQPAPVGSRRPLPLVCGRIGGSPGIGGRSSMARFIYQGRFTVFVEEAANREKFADIWATSCASGTGTVVLRG